ncbi:Gfo/Idh/MocA family oxidoreductase [Endozoicomonas lisbonensis]|uniref:Thiazolinyl reductase component of yersiniabactin synthetase n=1 Tax=Endozoicomonas lisbonensis TaxID=3120522 RepID=A0ABV2SAZ6_9GAMM
MNILVCGTNYGATYLRAIASPFVQDFRLAGILSTGSQRSQELAQYFSVPHFTDLAQLPVSDIDIACVAVPGAAGLNLIHGLLRQQVHVLAEHPMGFEAMDSCLKLAEQHGCCFHVNGHFADLNAPQAFFNAIKTAEHMSKALTFSVSVNLRTLYSGLDMLGRAMGSLENLEVTCADTEAREAYFRQLTIKGKDVTVSLLCQNFSSEHDDGSANLINHRLSAIFPHGNLLLAESNGPVLWFPTMTSVPAEQWRTVMPVEDKSLSSNELMQERDYANLLALHAIRAECVENQKTRHQQPDYLSSLARLWDACLKALANEA